jgi:predicted phosphodiesterase
MRWGIIADIHGNLPALVRVLRGLRDSGAQRVICLGDIVGYNAEPNRCVRLIETLAVESIAGNHDLMAIGRLDFTRCSLRPTYALRRTRRTLTEAARAFLARLPATRTYAGGLVLVHGSPDDVSEYMTDVRDIRRAAHTLRVRDPSARICLFGHTHDRKLWHVDGDRVHQNEADASHILDGRGLYFINPGSVDGSRRPMKQAEFAVLDLDTRVIHFHRVPYDDGLVERAARARGYRMEPWREATLRGVRWVRRLAVRTARVLRVQRGNEQRVQRGSQNVGQSDHL